MSEAPTPASEDVTELRRELGELRDRYETLAKAQDETAKRAARRDVREQEEDVDVLARRIGLSREQIEKAKDEAEYERTTRHLDRWLEQRKADLDALPDEEEEEKPPKLKDEKPPKPPKEDEPPEPQPHWSERRVTELFG